MKIIILLIFSFLLLKSNEIEPDKKNFYRELEEDDYSTNIIVYSSYIEPNRTIIPIIDDMKKTSSTKPTLLGFGGFPKTQSNQNNKAVKFNIYFKNVAKNKQAEIFLDYIYFKLIYKQKNFRQLDDNIENTQLLNGTLDKNTLSNNIVEYKVDSELENNYVSFDIKPNFQFGNSDLNVLNEDEFKEVEEDFDNESNDVYIISNSDLQNVNDNNKLDPKRDYIFFIAYELIKIGYLNYKIKGKFSNEINIKNEPIIFHYYDFDLGPRTFEGTFEKNNNEYYTLTTKFKDSINTNLENGCYANISKNTTIRILEENDFKQIHLMEENENVLTINEVNNGVTRFGRKIASSSGLSGGAIAGIVIICVVVVICVALAMIYFNQPVIKPTDASKIEYDNIANSSIQVIQQ